MSATDVIDVVEETLAALPERMSGNEANPRVAQRLRATAENEREAVIDAMRTFLAYRVPTSQRTASDAVKEARLWLALDVAEELGLTELKPDVEALVADVRTGKVLLPVHEKSVARYLRRLSETQ